ncbi:MAG: RNA-binding S4 domain-containing protein [Actinomycetaceae bacterium]|nr:RNA-binding S4 domain-containing protein [Actinomycetaceae bacterium]
MPHAQPIYVRCPIKLGQFLKLTGLVEDGAEARVAIASGDVDVNGEAETKRGRQLNPGDVVTVDHPASPARFVVAQTDSGQSGHNPQ